MEVFFIIQPTETDSRRMQEVYSKQRLSIIKTEVEIITKIKIQLNVFNSWRIYQKERVNLRWHWKSKKSFNSLIIFWFLEIFCLIEMTLKCIIFF